MKLQDVILRAMAKKITWLEAAEIIGVCDRTMRCTWFWAPSGMEKGRVGTRPFGTNRDLIARLRQHARARGLRYLE